MAFKWHLEPYLCVERCCGPVNVSTFTGSPSSFARSTSLCPEIARRKSSAKEVVTVTESWRAPIYVCGPIFTVAMTEVLGDGAYGLACQSC
jgi:hypothetical protein